MATPLQDQTQISGLAENISAAQNTIPVDERNPTGGPTPMGAGANEGVGMGNSNYSLNDMPITQVNGKDLSKTKLNYTTGGVDQNAFPEGMV